MAVLKGEVTFKVTFEKQGVPIGMYTSAIIFHECAKQVYANAPWTTIRDQKKPNYSVKMIENKIEVDN